MVTLCFALASPVSLWRLGVKTNQGREMRKRLGATAAAVVLALAGCGSDDNGGSDETPQAAVLAEALEGVEAADFTVREAEEADRLTYLTNGETITADDGFIVSQQGQPFETFVLTYSTSDAATVVADKRKEDVFAVGEAAGGLVFLAPDERTLKAVMDAAGS